MDFVQLEEEGGLAGDGFLNINFVFWSNLELNGKMTTNIVLCVYLLLFFFNKSLKVQCV